MKYIEKRPENEPADVIEKRNTPGSRFDDLPKKPLRKALLKEQGSLCAYCTQRIKNSGKTTKIEHFSPRTPENGQNYMNLLAVCKGNEGDAGNEHCDTFKANKTIEISPLKKECERLVRFDPGGKVYSLNDNIDRELNEILGLNYFRLVDHRIQILNTVKNEIRQLAAKNKDNKIREGQLNILLTKWKSRSVEDTFLPYCPIAINYLKKRIARL